MVMLIVFADESWAELLGALFQASQAADPGQREGAFRIFATTPGIIEKQHEAAVQEVFAKGFKDDDVQVINFSTVGEELVMLRRFTGQAYSS